jgi:hypothetical protein
MITECVWGGPSSDTAWYRGPGWQEAWPQWCTGLYALPSVVPWGQAVAIPESGATSQDALDGAAVKPFEDLRSHAKYFQSPEGE